ncbi:basic amino acid/polyamine antiporter, APA family [Catalinimonas alkaloidigena]|uniref:Basic amino acid/polyamine antiporter, APA family n=1 Tax=Catalinimonas alkaloidigena TaxID=1075417 RepID=A0A1G8Y4U9_9BACT|nr:amino acid permease [Catalinimonas alkaloidigena]SDJ97424.1 basic amino acid/polyamine antiporter, APA family [Catalinimonas alkaloidigena]
MMHTSERWMARKPVAHFEADQQRGGLRRILGKWSLTSLGIGHIIGAGIFVMTGLAAREYAGPALALSFVVAGLGCAAAGLCYAEMASLLPVEGSAYAYAYATVGELFAWIIGWDLLLEYAMGASTVAVGWSGYLAKLLALFHVHLPLWLMHDPHTAQALLTQATGQGTLDQLAQRYSDLTLPSVAGLRLAFNLPAFLIIGVITAVLVRGIREAAGTNLVMVVVKLAVVLFVIIAGAKFVDPANWSPFIPTPHSNDHGEEAFGWGGIVAGAAYVFFAYIGFDAVSTQAGEARRPRQDVPFGILASLCICTVLYIGVSLVLTGMVPYTELDITAPIADAFARRGLAWAVWIISIAAVAGLTSVLLVTLLAQSRVLYAMAKDGLMPQRIFGVLHPRFITPYRGTLLTGLLTAIVAALTPIELIAKLVNIGTLLAFVMVCVAVWRMRLKEPHLHRPFRVRALPVVATLGIVFNLGMMLSLAWENWARLAAWLLLGLVVYFFYGRHRSVLQKSTAPPPPLTTVS